MRMKWLTFMLLVGCAHQPSPAMDSSAMLTWFQQYGLETRNLQITSRPANDGSAGGLPQRIQFKTPKPAGALEAWRLKLRDALSAWLVEKGHPEGSCTSVDLTPEQDLVAVDIQIVCR